MITSHSKVHLLTTDPNLQIHLQQVIDILHLFETNKRKPLRLILNSRNMDVDDNPVKVELLS